MSPPYVPPPPVAPIVHIATHDECVIWQRAAGCVMTSIPGCPVACTEWPDPIAGCRAGPPTIIYVNVAVSRMPAVVAHEEGHAVDCELDPLGQLRPEFAEIDTPGEPFTRVGSAERLAQWYALCRFNRRLTRPFRRNYFGFVATPAKHIRVCDTFRRLIDAARA